MPVTRSQKRARLSYEPPEPPSPPPSESPFAGPGLKRPGADLAWDAYAKRAKFSKAAFPSAALVGQWYPTPLSLREHSMLLAVNAITDKAGWTDDVHDPATLDAWKTEIVVEGMRPREKSAEEMAAKATGDRYDHFRFRDTNYVAGSDETLLEYDERIEAGFTDHMWEATVNELKAKAAMAQTNGGIIGVFDAAGSAFKADGLVGAESHAALRAAAAQLEAPEEAGDRLRPGRDTTYDLVHPSMYPLVYGVTRIVRDRQLTVDTAVDAIGAGDPIAVPDVSAYSLDNSTFMLSDKFQWLPCEVDITDGGAKIATYINNVHPRHHAGLYRAVEAVIDAALPMLHATYEHTRTYDRSGKSRPSRFPGLWQQQQTIRSRRNRITPVDLRNCRTPELCKANGSCSPANMPEGWRLGDGVVSEEQPSSPVPNVPVKLQRYNKYYDPARYAEASWWRKSHPVVLSDPPAADFGKPWFTKFNTTGLSGGRLQFIVTLANIELTPENPRFAGGDWHIEGQLNERVCATALYYYDNVNVTDSYLALRTSAEPYHYPGCRMPEPPGSFLDANYGSGHEIGMTDMLGRIHTREGRLITFPNVYQHRVSPFELVDKTRPGHRKILALFLVDPETPIISTANVPPQQRSWLRDANNVVGNNLPPELADIIYDEVQCPYSLDVAQKFREELTKDRTERRPQGDKRVFMTD